MISAETARRGGIETKNRYKKTDMNHQTEAEPKVQAKKRGGLPKAVLRGLSVFLILTLFLCAVVFLSGRYTRTHYKITFYQMTSDKVSGGIRIAVLSDVHNREYGAENETLLSDLRALKPDLFLFPGDMVIREQEDYGAVLHLVSACSESAPCYGVLGNHESERIYYGNDRQLIEKFENAGLRLLRNAREEVRIGENTVQLLGVEGTSYGFEEYGGREFMEKTDVDPSAFCILMAHIPILFEPQLSGYGFDLGIAGHVHGGIVRLPFLGGLYSHEEGFFPKFSAGQYILANGQTLIISAGLGDSKSFPPRINNTPELTVIDINR